MFANVTCGDKCRRRFCTSIPMDKFSNMNALMVQLMSIHTWINGGLYRKGTTLTALFHANHTLTQGSLHYRLATLGFQKYNAYSVEKGVLIYYLRRELFRYQRKRITIESLIQSNKLFVNHRRRRWYVGIPMNEFTMMNVVMIQRRIFFAGILMNIFCNINALMVQLGTSCPFDSPGLARNEPTPGQRSQGDSTP